MDIFFIDWEKPRKVLAKGAAREEGAPISCWRTLLAANEWNELQTLRMTFPCFTLVMMVRWDMGPVGAVRRMLGDI